MGPDARQNAPHFDSVLAFFFVRFLLIFCVALYVWPPCGGRQKAAFGQFQSGGRPKSAFADGSRLASTQFLSLYVVDLRVVFRRTYSDFAFSASVSNAIFCSLGFYSAFSVNMAWPACGGPSNRVYIYIVFFYV